MQFRSPIKQTDDFYSAFDDPGSPIEAGTGSPDAKIFIKESNFWDAESSANKKAVSQFAVLADSTNNRKNKQAHQQQQLHVFEAELKQHCRQDSSALLEVQQVKSSNKKRKQKALNASHC